MACISEGEERGGGFVVCILQNFCESAQTTKMAQNKTPYHRNYISMLTK